MGSKIKLAPTLPMGWAEVPASMVFGDSGTPEDEWKGAENPEEPCKELRRWVRGRRYVRVVEYIKRNTEDKFFATKYGKTGANKDQRDEYEIETLDEAVLKVRILMRKGGRP